jgi:predicted nucleic acid-binding protein
VTALADTSVFIAREQDRPFTAPPPDDVAVSVVTVGELHLGVLMAPDVDRRATRLATLRLVEQLEPLPIDETVAQTWATLVARLRTSGQRMPINDSWIAATALVHGMPVVTRDADYDDVPGLRVVKV